jgi:hypothetical protein
MQYYREYPTRKKSHWKTENDAEELGREAD